MKKILFALSIVMLTACGTRDEHTNTDAGHSKNAHADEPMKGPHRGRLLSDGDISVEVAIFEAGVPPEFHVYASKGGKPVSPSDVQLSIEVKRLGGAIDRFTFVPENDYLKANSSVHEPHSFDVKVAATIAGKSSTWSYSSYEGRTTIASDMAAAAGIKTATVQAGTLKEMVTLYGNIVPNAEHLRSVSARFPGLIRSVSKQIGDTVKAGETLATIESNESLQTYHLTAPIAGVITQRHANVGEAANSESLFVIADYSSVWAELTFFAKDRTRLKVGQHVKITATEGELADEGIINYIAPTHAASNQTLIARVVLPNTDARWTPGLFVNGAVTVDEIKAPLLVANSGLQSFRDFTVVFAQVGDTYEVRMLELGRSDGEFTEVLGGIDAGTTYVNENSYLIKADIEKSGASHDH